MRNRWGIEIKKGYHAWAKYGIYGSRNDERIEGPITRIDKSSDFAKAYGPQVTIKVNARGDEIEVHADDVYEVLPPMRIGRGGVVKANPAEIHIDIDSHNTKGRNVRAKNPIKHSADWWREECNYISNVTDKRGNVKEMNNSIEVFIRYCVMQRDQAEREGQFDAATFIQECIDDLEAGINEWYKNPTPRLTRYDQPSQRERISERTGRPTKTPSKRLKNRRLATHHFAPEGVWANPLTRVKLKSPAQRSGDDPSPRLLKRRKVTAKAPKGFYANPIKGAIKFANIERDEGYVFGVDAVTPVTFVFTERERTARGKWYKSYRLPDWLVNSSEFQQWANENVRAVMSLNELKKFLSGFQK